MNRYDLEGHVVVVTGGAQGIGHAVAERASKGGAKLALWDMEGSLAEDAAGRLGDGHLGLAVDVSDESSVADAFDRTRDAFGGVHALVNSAGITGPNTTVEAYPPADWRRVLDVNLTGTFLTCRAVTPVMKEAGYGRILNIASVAGKEGNPNASAYSASKAGVIALTKSLAKELADIDVAVNCVTPAAARTRIFEQMTEQHIDYMLSKIPRGRFLLVEEAASMICWLISPENSFATGAAFDLSGGRATY